MKQKAYLVTTLLGCGSVVCLVLWLAKKIAYMRAPEIKKAKLVQEHYLNSIEDENTGVGVYMRIIFAVNAE